MNPSDYRYNPFVDISTSIHTTETYKIPSLSPYTIQLIEVPKKNNPSTMTVKKISSISGGAVSYGVTFTEVATTPSVDQFLPDYNTSADGDPNWNTGTIEFSSENAGQLVEISYSASGTLASVRANRFSNDWVDLGDGRDGDFRPSSDMVIMGMAKNYKSIFIPAGVVVYIDMWAKIRCQGACVIEGVIRVLGGAGGVETSPSTAGNPGTASFGGGAGGNGGGAGGAGGGNLYLPSIFFTWGNSAALLLVDSPFPFYGGGGGSGGRGMDTSASDPNNGAGGRGGGYLYLVAKTVMITGIINANGEDGGYGKRRVGGGGGGGGGVVVIIGQELIGMQRISVSGGAGGGNYADATPGTAGTSGQIAYKELGWS